MLNIWLVPIFRTRIGIADDDSFAVVELSRYFCLNLPPESYKLMQILNSRTPFGKLSHSTAYCTFTIGVIKISVVKSYPILLVVSVWESTKFTDFSLVKSFANPLKV